MIRQIKEVSKDIFDLLALCSSYVLKELSRVAYEFATFPEDDYLDVYDAITSYVADISYCGREKAFYKLKKFVVQYFEKGISLEKCYAFVQYIDELVECTIEENLLNTDDMIQYNSLSMQYTDEVRIIPKRKKFFQREKENRVIENSKGEYQLFRKSREYCCSALDEETNSYMIWDKKSIQDYPFTICLLTDSHPISMHFSNKTEWTFGIVPFLNESIEDILDLKYERRAFFVKGIKSNVLEKLKKRYQDIYRRSEKNQLDFLIFPEMLLSEEIIDSSCTEDRIGATWIVINGSISKDKVNKSIVTTGEGKVLFHYCKKEPYTFKEKEIEYKEYLDTEKNKEYTILESSAFGRIGVCICKDLLSEKVKCFHKHIGTDLLLVPAFSKSMDLHASAENLSKEYNCIVVMVNACSAIIIKNKETKKQRLGFITMPAKTELGRSTHTHWYYMGDCLDSCEKQCVGKKISIDLSKIKQYNNDGISYFIEESMF